MIINPSELSARDAYKLMITCIVPRPIAFVSTVNVEGVFNAAPFSFFTGISSKPPMLCFAPGRKRTGEKKDSWRNIKSTSEFVINVVTEAIAEQMNICATDYPEEMSEFVESKLTPIPSEVVGAPRIKESPVQMECRLIQIVEFEQIPNALVIGEVVLYHLHDDLLSNGYGVDVSKLKPVGRLGGSKYCKVNDIFEMERLKYEAGNE